jgi:DNA-binding NtrC family response regulator
MSEAREVLVLDDEEIVCDRLRRHLEKTGFAVETFTDSQSAIDRLADKAFDVVVTDVKMKGPTGLEVLRFVRDQRKGTQVIIITGYPGIETARQAEFGGAFEFISKPFQLEQLATLVKKAAKRARKERSRPGDEDGEG